MQILLTQYSTVADRRVRRRGIELSLFVTHTAGLDALTRTVDDAGAPELWVTGERKEALILDASRRRVRTRSRSLVGREEEGQ